MVRVEDNSKEKGETEMREREEREERDEGRERKRLYQCKVEDEDQHKRLPSDFHMYIYVPHPSQKHFFKGQIRSYWGPLSLFLCFPLPLCVASPAIYEDW